VQILATGKDKAVFDAAERLADDLGAAGSTSFWTTGRCRRA